MIGYTQCTRNWIGFLLIKISNLTPECAVFNETASGVGAGFSHYSHGCRSYKARYIDEGRGGNREKKKVTLIRGECMKAGIRGEKLTVTPFRSLSRR